MMKDIGLPYYELKEFGDINQLSEHVGWGLKDLKIPESWMKTKGEGVVIMVMDSGVTNHPDIGDNELKKFSKSFLINESKLDIQGHSTHVGGIISSQNNAMGIVGVAPKAKIISVKVIDKYGKTNEAILKSALEYAIKLKPDIINMSLGSYDKQPSLEPLYKKLTYELNIPIVCAAGNFGKKGVMYPAKYPYTISVGSYKEGGALSDFSSFSPENYVDFVAPGDTVLSTYLNGQYAIMSGTSMAAPFVSGILALLISKYKTLGTSYKVEELRNILASTSIDVGDAGRDNKFGYGVINVERALREIEGYNLTNQVFIPKKTWIQKIKEKIKWK
jgi:subtilisin family serine protease